MTNQPAPSSGPNIAASCEPSGGTVQIITSGDPNDKVGSLGIGPQHYVSAATPLHYAIEFENVLTASAPAARVVVSDQLNVAVLDLSTLALGPIATPDQLASPPPGSRGYSAVLDLRPTNNLLVSVNAQLNTLTGLLTWTFQSLDPVTNQAPTDPRAGFLPPGASGNVFFTVMPIQGLATNTQVQNQATVVFDVNAPVSTPTWLNTLDNTGPTSRVAPMPQNAPTANFDVTWSGSDVGSGIQDFTIFVSDNGGPYNAWQKHTSATLGSYQGLARHTYGFYSIARDLTGNVENSKTTAEATTKTPTLTWLPLLGTGTADPTTFDAGAAPVVEVCPWSGTTCSGALVARFTTVPVGTDSLLTVSTAAGQYEGSWNLLNSSFTTRKTYRIRVLQGTTELGAISVDVVRGRWALTQIGSLAPLVAATSLPIRFHLAR